MTIAWIIILIAAAYLAAGCLFAVVFLRGGIERVDPAAKGTPWKFKVLVFPGLVALWPVMLMKWRAGMQAGSLHHNQQHEEARP